MNTADITQRSTEPAMSESNTIEMTLMFASFILAIQGKQRIAPKLTIIKIESVSVRPAVRNLLKIPEIRIATHAKKQELLLFELIYE